MVWVVHCVRRRRSWTYTGRRIWFHGGGVTVEDGHRWVKGGFFFRLDLGGARTVNVNLIVIRQKLGSWKSFKTYTMIFLICDERRTRFYNRSDSGRKLKNVCGVKAPDVAWWRCVYSLCVYIFQVSHSVGLV